MCLTSIPAQFQEIDDFNFDEYDSEYLDDFVANDDIMFNDFLAGFMPVPSEMFQSEMAAAPMQYSNNPVASFHVQPVDFPMESCTMMTGMSKIKRSADCLNVDTSVMIKSEFNKNKRTKKRRRRAFSSDDPRRSYVDSIFGAINGGDSLLPVLQRIAHPDVVMTCRFLGDPSTLTVGKLFREVKGREQISMFVDALMMASPDSILRLHEKKMRLRQNNSSYVVAKYTFEGHQFCSLLTTNDKHVSKRALCPLKTVPAAASTVQAVAAACTKSSVEDCTSQDDSDISNGFYASSQGATDEDDWSEHLFEEMSTEDDMKAFSDVTSEDEESASTGVIQAKSEHLLRSWQFSHKPVSISGPEEKISVASSTTEFGLGNSFATPQFVSSIGTMALHINPNRQIIKIDFLWTYSKPKNADDRKSHK